MEVNLAGVVVFYKPKIEYILFIKEYVNELDKLYVFDNSEESNSTLIEALKEIPQIELIENKGNKGIAFALNCAALRALQSGYNFLLTMDQDSFLKKGELTKMKEAIVNDVDTDKNVAVWAPLINSGGGHNISTITTLYPKEVITSGSIIALEIWEKIGGFDETLFIYVVDFEYCWKCRKNGYILKRVRNTELQHNMSDYKIVDGKKQYCRNSYKEFYYYVVRNNLYFIREYFFFFPKESIIRCLKAIKFCGIKWIKEKNKLVNLKYIFYGISDFIIGRKGKCMH